MHRDNEKEFHSVSTPPFEIIQSVEMIWCLFIVFNCNKRLEISTFVYFASTFALKAVTSTDKKWQVDQMQAYVNLQYAEIILDQNSFASTLQAAVAWFCRIKIINICCYNFVEMSKVDKLVSFCKTLTWAEIKEIFDIWAN